MTEMLIPNWAAQQYQESQARFARQYAEFARQNKNDNDALQEEIPNLLMALDALLSRQSKTAVDMVNNLGNFFLYRGYWREGMDFADQAVPVAQQLQAESPAEEKYIYALTFIQVMRVGFQFMQGKVEEAGIILQQLFEADHLVEHQMISGALIALIGTMAEKRGEYEESLATYQKTLGQLEKVDYLPLISLLLSLMADTLTQQGKFEEALALYRRKLEVDRQAPDISSIIETLQGLARVARLAGLPDEAKESYRQAAELARSIASPQLQHDTLKDIANSAYEQEDYATAAQLYEQALAFARQSGNKSATAYTLTSLAFVREELGEDVTDLLKESLSLCQEMNDYDGMVMTMIQLGEVYLAAENIDRAKEVFAQALDLAVRIKNHHLIAVTCLQMGDLVAEQENWAKAERYYERRLAAHRHFDDPSSRAMILRGLGQARFIQDKLESAKDVIQTNIELYERLEDWENHAACLYELACIMAQKNNPVEARQLAQRSSNILHKIGSPEAAFVDAALARLGEVEGQEDSA